MRFVKANKILGTTEPGNIVINQNGPFGAAKVKFIKFPEFIGVIMPWKLPKNAPHINP